MQHNVLFLGDGNSARSIMAEAILNHEGGESFHAYSAGLRPAPELDQRAINLLTRLQYDISEAYPKDWSEFAGASAPEFDFIFTLCEQAALLPHAMLSGEPVFAHWDVGDPARTLGSTAKVDLAYIDTLRTLSTRIGIFMNLPLRTPGHLAAHHFEGIGGKQTAMFGV